MFSNLSVLCNQPECDVLLGADPKNDVVKVDPTRFDALHSRDADEENSQPPPLEVAAFQAAMKERREQELLRERALQELRIRRDEERRIERERQKAEKMAVERLAEERRKREQKEAEAEKQYALMKAEEENAKREYEEEERRKEQVAREAEEAQRLEQEKSAKATRDQHTLEEFLESSGFSGVNSKRTRRLRSKYPLHTAVKLNSLELVELLLEANADPTLRNSAGKTPAHLAMKLNQNGSHLEVIRSLQRIRTLDR